ncbi:helix-turn-helix transcriptional regulator [Leucobacter luti]|uniref:AraC-like DNA-binding protein n=1 Tax=Leucobacter luti TaxID=340320 RepID=A0A4V6MCY3_9MICO|nr:AraC family transcriptional regulator [Leucobacter luti]MBL3698792.1 AraC family transcriptional regulator [Leucobacter luti]RZT66169.1 AraC-like DNA-binding protein [Leucobacter luti]
MPLPLLTDYPLARAASPGRLRDAVGSLTGYGHAVHGEEPGRPHGVVNGLRAAELSLVYVAYATRVCVVAPPTGHHVVLVVPLGPMRVETTGTAAELTAPFALSASAETRMVPDPDAGALVGAVALEDLTAALRVGYGDERDITIDLAQPRPLPVQGGPALRRAWADYARGPAGDPALLVDRVMIGLAPYTSSGTSAGSSSPPAYLAHAVRHLRRHLAEPVSLAELGTAVGIGARQLQLAFQAHLGCTAQEYLRQARLDRAWALLRDGRGRLAPSIAAVAAEVGIPHCGRFSHYFAARFGVRPSELRE